MTHPLPPDHAGRTARVRLALDGLSVGDAFGERFFRYDIRPHIVDDEPYLSPGPWPTTDDTEMAVAIAVVLEEHGRIDQDALARAFAGRFRLDPSRGYGPGMIRLLNGLNVGGDWRLEARTLFGGNGSFGNGSAMRVAPVGGYFAGDGYDRVAEQAARSAEVTHCHPDGVAGAVAVAVAAAYAAANRDGGDLLATVLAHTPPGAVRDGVERAAGMAELSPASASSLLGNGSRVTCADTVPFCLWVAARRLTDYPAAVWETVKAGGDVDTTAAIVGGVVALAAGPDGIPAEWLARREELHL